MKKRLMPLVVSVILTFIIGCSSDSPLDVAEKFWRALEDDNIYEARSFATRATAISIKRTDKRDDEKLNVTFGEVTTDGWKTTVDTAAHKISGDSEDTIYLKTVLVQEEGEWKVDAMKTMMSALSDEFAEAMESAVEVMQSDEFNKAMQGMAEEMAEGMAQGMEEIMQKSLEEMNKSMKSNTY